jgi:hypothetical protein
MLFKTKMEIGCTCTCSTNSSYDASQSRGVVVRITRKESRRYLLEVESWSRWTGDTGETSYHIFRSLSSAEAYAEKVCRTGWGDCEWFCE